MNSNLMSKKAECDQRYAYKSTLERHEAVHVREKILDEQQKPKDSKICVDKNYSCVKCDYTCDSKRKLNTHNIAHSSKNCFTCKNCDFKTVNKFSFSRHQGECVQSYKYECRDCDSKFHFVNAFKTHANIIHRNLEPYACLYCN